jgi:putative sigma-54 modulation protein
MNITFQAVNFKADRKLIKFITEKVSKLDHFYDKIVDAVVYLKIENSNNNSNKLMELKLNVTNSTLFAEDRSSSFESACDLVNDSMRNQLMKFKGRQKA